MPSLLNVLLTPPAFQHQATIVSASPLILVLSATVNPCLSKLSNPFVVVSSAVEVLGFKSLFGPLILSYSRPALPLLLFLIHL